MNSDMCLHSHNHHPEQGIINYYYSYNQPICLWHPLDARVIVYDFGIAFLIQLFMWEIQFLTAGNAAKNTF